MSDWDTIQLLTRNLGIQIESLDAQMTRVRSAYDSLWAEVNQSKKISTSAELVDACKTPGNYQLEPGQYVGNFNVLADGVAITGASNPPGRIQPGATSQYTLAPSDYLKPTLTVLSSRFMMRGVNTAPVKPDRSVILIGSTTSSDPEKQPDLVVLDQIEVAAHPTLGGRRGIDVHTRNFTITDSRITGFLYAGEQSQAILSYNGPGPYTIINCELEASGENIMFGGADTKSAAMIPGNVKILNNLIRKPLTWRSKAGSVANSIEFKCVKGALVEGNFIDGCWKDIQVGNMIVLTPRNQYGNSPWSVVEDVTIRNNRSINHLNGFAVNISLEDNLQVSEKTKKITITGNLFEDSPRGFQILKGVLDFLRIGNNTLPKIKQDIISFDPAITNFTKLPLEFSRNVFLSGDYGAHGPSFSPGTPSLEGYCLPLKFDTNIIEKDPDRNIPWPAGNTVLAPGALAPFLDANYHYIPGGAGW